MVLAGLVVLLLAPVAHAQAPTLPPTPVLETKEELVAFATQEAVAGHVDAQEVLSIIQCESQWNTHAIGDHGHSFGLSQIHLPSHASISQEQAENPRFAVNFLVENIASGNAHMWTCARLLGY